MLTGRCHAGSGSDLMFIADNIVQGNRWRKLTQRELVKGAKKKFLAAKVHTLVTRPAACGMHSNM